MTEKRCPKCERIVPLDSFYNSRGTPDRKDHYCKACRDEMQRRRWLINKLPTPYSLARDENEALMLQDKRRCTKCEEVKCLSTDFYAYRKKKCGKDYWCKSCRSEIDAKRRAGKSIPQS